LSRNVTADRVAEPQINPGAPSTMSRGIRTGNLLVVVMALIIASATFASLLIVRHRLESQVTAGLSADLLRSVTTFENLQTQKRNALEHENALVADLPKLKALMTTRDDRTIQDGALEFWKISGNDLFALADEQGRVIAAYPEDARGSAVFNRDLRTVLANPARHYLVSGSRLYACSVRPLYFGSEESGTLLGYVVSGFDTEHLLGQISQATAVETIFASGNRALAGTLAAPLQAELTTLPVTASVPGRETPILLKLGGEQYVAVAEDLSSSATAPLRLMVLKSFDQAKRSIQQIDRLVLTAGLLALVVGTLLMLALSRVVTGPLEELAAGVRAFAMGDSARLLPHRGTMEVQELSTAFGSMRLEIQQANRTLLESERLATIGRMASSVSHDLRHYLASVYANAEFLASSGLSDTERGEIFTDIRMAVHGTTELLESLLVFSRTGSATRRTPAQVATLVDRAMTLVRAHPDAAGVSLTAECNHPAEETTALVEGRQIERALFNLLLNACQSARPVSDPAQVVVRLDIQGDRILVEVIDNGEGVPESIRATLFQPFVSEGKQKGSGLGLTLSHCIAAEHGGELILVSSRPGCTIFRMSIARGQVPPTASADENRPRAVTRQAGGGPDGSAGGQRLVTRLSAAVKRIDRPGRS